MSDRGGGLTRDVILRISAQNLSTADFRAATAAVNELTAAVDKQVAAAGRGVVKEKELTETLAKLNEVSKGLQGFARTIENLKGLDTQIAAQVQAVAAAKKAWEDQQATVEAADRVTQRMTTRLASLERGYKAAQKALEDQTARQKAYSAELEQNGLDAQNLANAEKQILAVAEQTGAVVNKLTQARDNYAKILRETREEEQRNISAQTAATAAAQNRAAAEREVAAALERVNARVIERDRAAAHAEVGTGAQAYLANLAAERKAVQDRIAADRAAAQAEVSAGAQAHLTALAAERKAEQDRIAAERAAAIERGRIRQAANEIELNLQKQMSAARRKAEVDDVRRAKEAAVERMMVEKRARDEAVEDETRAAIRVAELQRRANLGALGRLREDHAERRRLAREEVEDRQRASRALQAQLRQTGDVEEQQTRRRASTQKPEQKANFLGLRPYEMTNLGYQGVDVVQGLLAGTSGGIIAAQQGPQILQIFGLAVLKWAPLIVAGLGTIAVAVGALQRVFREQAAGREFGGLLAANAQSINYNKQQLVDLGKAARDMGMSWKEGIDAIKIAMSSNIAQDRIKTLLQAAQDVNDVYGTKVPDAMKQFATALSGSGDELLKLGADYRLFSREEQEYIRNQVAAGKIEEARRFTIDRLAQTMRERAKIALDPWTAATRELSKGWDDFLTAVAKTDAFKAANSWILTLIDSLGKLGTEIDRTL